MKYYNFLKSVFFLFLLVCSNAISQNWEWAIGGKGYDSFDYSNAIVVDNSGNVYIAGYFQSANLSFGTKTIANRGKEDIFVAKFDPQGNCLWTLDFGGEENDRATCITILGNFLIVGGYFESQQAKFGNYTISATLGSDVFVAVLNSSDGSLLQLKTFGGDGYDEPTYIFVDQNNNLYIAGEFSGGYIVFGADTVKNFNYGTPYKGMSDGFLVKYSPEGNPLFAKGFGGVGNDRLNACVVDSEGMVYLYGTYNSNRMVFVDTMYNKGYSDIFLVKYDQKNNKYIWQIEISGTDKEYPASILLSNDNYIYITGEFQSDVLRFRDNSFTNQGSYDFFIIKLDTNGNIIKARSFGNYSDEYAKKIVQDKNGNILIGGYFASSTLSLDDLTASNSASDSFSDIFVAKFDPDLKPLWIQSAGGKGEDQSFAIAVDNNGNVYQTGNFESREIFFNKTSIYNFGYSNIFLAKLNPKLPLEVDQSNNPTQELKIFPNPFEETVQIVPFESNFAEKCQLFNPMGEIVQEFQLPGPTKIIFGNLPAGIYFIKFKNKVYTIHKI
ncbi:MAG: T9SS type A sorting domain-containing protein [Candidatus Kapaibacteriota bacterium]